MGAGASPEGGRTWCQPSWKQVEKKGLKLPRYPKLQEWMRFLRLETEYGYTEKSLARRGSFFNNTVILCKSHTCRAPRMFSSVLQCPEVYLLSSSTCSSMRGIQVHRGPLRGWRILRRTSRKCTQWSTPIRSSVELSHLSACWEYLCHQRPLLLSSPACLYEWSVVTLQIKLLFSPFER